jgi:hypothetical protein
VSPPSPLAPFRPPVEILDDVVVRLRERRAKGHPPLNLEASPLDQLQARIESMMFLAGGVIGAAWKGHPDDVRSALLEVIALGIETLQAHDAVHPPERSASPIAQETP